MAPAEPDHDDLPAAPPGLRRGVHPRSPADRPAAGDPLRAVGDAHRERDRSDLRWGLRLERPRHEAERAARQYQACEPENRMVGREPGRRWERAPIGQRVVEGEYGRSRRGQHAGLAIDEIDVANSPSKDVAGPWRAPTTTVADRQAIVRYLVERVSVSARGESERVDVTIHRAGGFVSRHEIRRPVRRVERLRDYLELMARAAEPPRAGKTPGRSPSRWTGGGTPAEAARDR